MSHFILIYFTHPHPLLPIPFHVSCSSVIARLHSPTSFFVNTSNILNTYGLGQMAIMGANIIACCECKSVRISDHALRALSFFHTSYPFVLFFPSSLSHPALSLSGSSLCFPRLGRLFLIGSLVPLFFPLPDHLYLGDSESHNLLCLVSVALFLNRA